MAETPLKVLVVCTGNRARSQMAEGWLRHFGQGRLEVSSAGTRPGGVHPLSIEVMGEVGIDISHHTSDHVDQYKDERFDVVVTVCDHANEVCPVFTNADQRVHHGFPDPEGDSIDPATWKDGFRTTRDQIKAWAEPFAAALLTRQ